MEWLQCPWFCLNPNAAMLARCPMTPKANDRGEARFVGFFLLMCPPAWIAGGVFQSKEIRELFPPLSEVKIITKLFTHIFHNQFLALPLPPPPQSLYNLWRNAPVSGFPSSVTFKKSSLVFAVRCPRFLNL